MVEMGEDMELQQTRFLAIFFCEMDLSFEFAFLTVGTWMVMELAFLPLELGRLQRQFGKVSSCRIPGRE